MCWECFKLQRSAVAFSVGVNTNDEATGSGNRIAIRRLGNVGVGNHPAILPKLDNKPYRNSTAIVIGMNKSCKER